MIATPLSCSSLPFDRESALAWRAASVLTPLLMSSRSCLSLRLSSVSLSQALSQPDGSLTSRIFSMEFRRSFWTACMVSP
ncbi:hypothetical protein C3488_27895 [Streptomyces sp. Ru72]|nr:hypothetical protein C3488_27895 [Streptomyces sp. Ru72]